MAVLMTQSRAERFVVWARVVLALSSLAAGWLDPLDMSPAPRLTYGLIAVFTVWSVLVSFRITATPLWWRMTTHVVDFLIFTALIMLTRGPASPFFFCYVFALFCALVRFDTRAAFLTAAAAMLMFVGTGFVLGWVMHDSPFELNRFVIRTFDLGVIAALLVYVGRHQEGIRGELSRIAAWPREALAQDDVISDLLRKASDFLHSRRMMLWFDALRYRRLFSAHVEENGFVCEELPVDEIDRQAASLQGVTLEIAGDVVRGRLTLLDRSEMVGEERALSEIVARLVASRLDQFCMMQEYRRMAVAEERVRVGRDLHDSILQSLTGAALQLKTVARVMEKDPERARGRIAEIQEIIAADQRELRWFIDQLQERAQISMDGEPYDIAARMKFLVHRFRQHWDLDVRYELDPLIQLLPGTLRAEVFALISEGVANAAKHASPSRVWVEVKAAGRSVEIRVEDDGHGFPFVGRYDLSELVESKRGPVTLKERVMSLNGSMSIDSATDGSRIDIRIPMAAEVM